MEFPYMPLTGGSVEGNPMPEPVWKRTTLFLCELWIFDRFHMLFVKVLWPAIIPAVPVFNLLTLFLAEVIDVTHGLERFEFIDEILWCEVRVPATQAMLEQLAPINICTGGHTYSRFHGRR